MHQHTYEKPSNSVLWFVDGRSEDKHSRGSFPNAEKYGEEPRFSCLHVNLAIWVCIESHWGPKNPAATPRWMTSITAPGELPRGGRHCKFSCHMAAVLLLEELSPLFSDSSFVKQQLLAEKCREAHPTLGQC